MLNFYFEISNMYLMIEATHYKVKFGLKNITQNQFYLIHFLNITKFKHPQLVFKCMHSQRLNVEYFI